MNFFDWFNQFFFIDKYHAKITPKICTSERKAVSLQSNSISYTMATISLSLSAKADKTTGKSEILIRFVVGSRINQRGKTNIFIDGQYWDAKEAHIAIPHFRLMTDEKQKIISELTEADTQLANLTKHIMESFQAAGAGKTELPKDWLKTTISDFNDFPTASAEAEQQTPFFEVFETYINGKKFSKNRKKGYVVLKRILQRYELYTQNPITFEGLTADTLRDFENFLKVEHTYEDVVMKTEYVDGEKKEKTYFDICKEEGIISRKLEQRGGNAISDLMRRFRAFVRWANGLDKDYKLENPFTTNNPFNTYAVPKELYGTPYYITIEERNQLYHTQLEEPLATQRDIFVFQCCIGCRVSDLWDMTKKNINNGACDYIADKTKDENPRTIHVPLNTQASEIIEKYKDYQGEKLFPFTTQQQYNEDIKEMLKLAGVDRVVTVLNSTTREEEQRPINEVASSHMGRRSFIGNLYKKTKDPNWIASLSGHVEGSRAFSRYRDIDEEMKKELVSMLD